MQVGSKRKRQSLTKPKVSEEVNLPILIKFPIVAKFLCNFNDKLIDFTKDHSISLEREPDNKYDRRAIKVVVRQKDDDLHVKN